MDAYTSIGCAVSQDLRRFEMECAADDALQAALDEAVREELPHLVQRLLDCPQWVKEQAAEGLTVNDDFALAVSLVAHGDVQGAAAALLRSVLPNARAAADAMLREQTTPNAQTVSLREWEVL